MIKLILLFLVLLVRVVFTFVKSSGKIMSFPFDEHTVSLEFYIFQICDKVAWVIVIYMLAVESTKYRFSLWVFFAIFVADIPDFILTYNNEYSWIGVVPVTLNNIAAVVFLVSIITEFIWEKLGIS